MVSGADPASRLRVLHHHRCLRRRLARQPALGRPWRTAGAVLAVAIWAVPFGLVGGRLYHVITDYQLYFNDGGPGRRLRDLGGRPRHLGRRRPRWCGRLDRLPRRGITAGRRARTRRARASVAQAIGRWGNWFNQELFGRPTDLPWGLEIDAGATGRWATGRRTYHPRSSTSRSVPGVAGLSSGPTGACGSGHGRAFASTSPLYTVGAAWVGVAAHRRRHPHPRAAAERLDRDHTSSSSPLVYIVISAKLRPGREEIVEPRTLTQAGGSTDQSENG